MIPHIVMTYAAGDAVPEWMIEVTPDGPDSRTRTPLFAGAGAILEMAGRYYIVPESVDGSQVIDWSGGGDGDGYSVRASSGDVILPLRTMTFYGESNRGKGETVKVR